MTISFVDLHSLSLFTTCPFLYHFIVLVSRRTNVARAALDKMGHVVKYTPSVGAKKISVFQADIGSCTSALPAGLGSPFFVPKVVVTFR